MTLLWKSGFRSILGPLSQGSTPHVHGAIIAWHKEKLSDCRLKRKVERERRVRIAAQRRAEKRGGSSSPASGSVS
jgi:hypothetical protein